MPNPCYWLGGSMPRYKLHGQIEGICVVLPGYLKNPCLEDKIWSVPWKPLTSMNQPISFTPDFSTIYTCYIWIFYFRTFRGACVLNYINVWKIILIWWMMPCLTLCTPLPPCFTAFAQNHTKLQGRLGALLDALNASFPSAVEMKHHPIHIDIYMVTGFFLLGFCRRWCSFSIWGFFKFDVHLLGCTTPEQDEQLTLPRSS